MQDASNRPATHGNADDAAAASDNNPLEGLKQGSIEAGGVCILYGLPIMLFVLGFTIESDDNSVEAKFARMGPAVLLTNHSQSDLCEAYGITLTPYFIVGAKLVGMQIALTVFMDGGPGNAMRNLTKPMGKASLVFIMYQLVSGKKCNKSTKKCWMN